MQRFQESKKALGSQAIITIVTNDEVKPHDIFSKLWQQVADFENRFSRFLATSELSNFNTHAGTKTVISGEFKAMLEACRRLCKVTNGVFNPFILPALQRAGYVGSWPSPADYTDNPTYPDRTIILGIEQLQIGDNWSLIPASGALDFGGIGKGYLLDQLAKFLSENLIHNYWLSLGGDIICNGFDLGNQAWSVGIQDVDAPEDTVGEINNHDGRLLAIATSGITKRRGVHAGVAWHHIINPKTGQPAITDTLSASLSAPSAVEADVYAKCAVILGSVEAKQLLLNTAAQAIYIQTLKGNLITYKLPEEVA